MCGICCVFCFQSNQQCKVCCSDRQDTDSGGKERKSRLANRGPDRSGECHLQSLNFCASFVGHVLHLRGTEVAQQPAKDQGGNILLWNGEIFDGIEVPGSSSDTDILLARLGECASEEQILSTMAQIEGPWAFMFWQQSTETLWFGRDVFGRRSLLWHLPKDNSDVFCLSSVQIKPRIFSEVPSVGIFKMSIAEAEDKQSCSLTLFPWKRAVWPGTMELLNSTDYLQEKILSGECRESVCVDIHLCASLEVPSQMPVLNKSLPPTNSITADCPSQQEHIDYLKEVLQKDEYMTTLSHQLADVLLKAVRTRVLNQPKYYLASGRTLTHVTQPDVNSHSDLLSEEMGGATNYPACTSVSHDHHVTSSARVAILFSGGIDSTVIAALADKCVPKDEPIDLLNVAFELKPKAPAQPKKRSKSISETGRWNVPDRVTGYTALSELNPERQWNFIEINVTAEELQIARQQHIQELVYPLQTVLDDSIGCAVWFAARGKGILGAGPDKGSQIFSDAGVILCGMGADEQLVGYSRHRNRYKEEGWKGLIDEIELEVTRISARNLGRDDRIITDHGKESRFPFLDEKVVQFLSGLPIHHKANLDLPRGLGEKLLLRLCAVNLGLHKTATLPKRAIQFGSRIAKLENSKEKASDVCDRLTDLST